MNNAEERLIKQIETRENDISLAEDKIDWSDPTLSEDNFYFVEVIANLKEEIAELTEKLRELPY